MKDVKEVRKLFRCLNCGFIFKNPKMIFRSPVPPGEPILIDRRALYVPACPKCGSDAIVPISTPIKNEVG